MSDPSNELNETAEPANLRFLRRLVTTLTATMIIGLIAIFAVLVIRLQASEPSYPTVEVLPDGVTVDSVTFGSDYIFVISKDRRGFLISRDGKTLKKEVSLDP